jgi:hypothetical protein
MGASPDAAQLAQLDAYAVSSGDATQFAGQVPLQAQQVAYLAQNGGSRWRVR